MPHLVTKSLRMLTLTTGALGLTAHAQTTIVDWGASSAYVSSNVVLNGYATSGKAFDLTTPINPASGYSTPSGLSSTFYGGSSIVSTNGTGTWGAAGGQMVRDNITTPAFGGVDALRLYPTWNGTTGDGQQKFYFAAAFKKSDFLNNAGSGTVSLAGANGTFSITYALTSGYQANNNRLRLIVQDGGNWYISNATSVAVNSGVLTATNTFSSRTWSSYNPSALNSIGASASPAFTDVTAVGYWWELSSLGSINNGTNGAAWVSDFTITGDISAVPEPSTFGVLAGLGALAGASGRRRRQQPSSP